MGQILRYKARQLVSNHLTTDSLPIQMLQYVEERPDPTIAAISAGLIHLAVIVMIIGDRLVGLRRLVDF